VDLIRDITLRVCARRSSSTACVNLVIRRLRATVRRFATMATAAADEKRRDGALLF
jgi:hypothetical protein